MCTCVVQYSDMFCNKESQSAHAFRFTLYDRLTYLHALEENTNRAWTSANNKKNRDMRNRGEKVIARNRDGNVRWQANTCFHILQTDRHFQYNCIHAWLKLVKNFHFQSWIVVQAIATSLPYSWTVFLISVRVSILHSKAHGRQNV